MQYNWKYRRYRGKRKTSVNFDDVVPNRVNIVLDPLMWYPYTDTHTPFSQVQLMPFQVTKELTSFFHRMERKPTRPTFIWREFKQAIFEGWMLDKIHVIGASSGYDSRMIAKAVRELYIEHGRDWLGETYFVECAGEEPGFREIMKSLGWEDRAISWKPRFDMAYFKDHHKKYNGLCAYPMNQWYDFYIKNWNENDIQYISGYGGNVADAMNPYSPYMGKKKLNYTVNGRLIMYFKHQYFYQVSAFRQPKHSFHPFWSWRYIEATANSQHRYDRTSIMLSKMFVKECKHVKRMRILGEVTDNGHREVSPYVIKQLKEWYNSTDYGKKYKVRASRKIEYNYWWLQFCIANYVTANNISFR